MLGVAVMAMRWHHARLRRLEAERCYRLSEKSHPFGLGEPRLRSEMEEARRIESRYKRRLSQSCEKASDKPKHAEIIDI
ncbi:MAG TPA: hypothetical protein DD803_06955 [Alcaligenes faecalis]|nr:hypothetical protein [Alcaligenes faecalis]